MKTVTPKTMSASRVSLFLVALLIVLILVLLGGSGFAASLLIARSRDATHAAIDTDVSGSEPQRLEELKQYLARNATGISQTATLTAGLGNYNQSTIVSTISGYAVKAGVSISSFDFQTPNAAASAATAGSANTVSVTLVSPVPYTKLIAFLKLLEQGLMPAEIIAGNIASGEGGAVTVTPLTIKVAG